MKKLPVNLNPEVELECWHFYRTAILETDSKFDSWMLERFNNIYMYDDFTCSYDNWEIPYFFDIYNEVIEYNDINPHGNIIKAVKDEIDRERYVLAFCDRYYVPGSFHYQKIEYRHEMMIYGYDQKYLYYVDIWTNGKMWAKNKILFSEFEESFWNAMSQIDDNTKIHLWITEYNLPLVSMRLKKESFNRKYKLIAFWDGINQNLLGKVMNTKVYLNGESHRPKLCRTGMAIYEGYYIELERAIEQNVDIKLGNILGGINKLLAIKKSFKRKIHYIMEDNNIIEQDILDKSQELINYIQLVKNILLKYEFKDNKEYLEKAIEYLKKAENLDYELLQMSSAYIERLMVKQMKKISSICKIDIV